MLIQPSPEISNCYELRLCSRKATTYITEQQKDTIKVNVNVDDDESGLHALIEKVVNDEIKQLAKDRSPVKSSEVIKLNSAPLLNVFIIPSDDSPATLAAKEKIHTTTTAASFSVQDEQTELSATSGSMDLDSETIVPTNAPAVEIATIKLETISDDDTTTEVLQNRDKVLVETTTTRDSAVSAAAEVAAAVTNGLQVDENVNEENSISDSLLSAVGDLLSSILGLDGSKEGKTDENAIDDENEDENNVNSDKGKAHNATASETTIVPTAETFTTINELESTSEASSDETTGIEQGTEKFVETATPVGYEGELNSERESTETTDDAVPLNHPSIALSAVHFEDLSEIDLKIENLANAQTSLATESTPEQVTETVSVELTSEGVKYEPDMLEVISDPSNEKPVLFEESVNQVMNLMKNTAGRVPLGDSFLIDKHMMKDNVNILDDVVYGTLKEIESSLGMNQHEMSLDLNGPVSTQQDDLIKNFEAEINKSLINKHPYPFVTFLPSSSKAALQSHFQDNVDF